MYGTGSVFFRGFVLPLGLAMLVANVSYGGRPEATPPLGYKSPVAVYSAYRNAREKGDWRTVFFCMTPRSRDGEVFPAYDGCLFRQHDPKVRAVMKKYGVEVDKVMKRYVEEYKKKHGVALPTEEIAGRDVEKPKTDKPTVSGALAASADSVAPVPNGPPPPSLPPVDNDILRKLVLQMVTDKAGFYAEAMETYLPHGRQSDSLLPEYSNLEELRVSGDEATGRVTMTTFMLRGAPGEPERREKSLVIRGQALFRRLDGRWFLVGIVSEP